MSAKWGVVSSVLGVVLAAMRRRPGGEGKHTREALMPRGLRIVAAAVLSISSGHALAGPYSAIYSFGDSLSDVGNAFIATGGAQPAPPYYSGVFSNGPIWLQDLAPMLGLPAPAPSLPPDNGSDYAIGDASTGSTLIYTAGMGDLPAQIQAFEAAHPGGAPSERALYVFDRRQRRIRLVGGSGVRPDFRRHSNGPGPGGAQRSLCCKHIGGRRRQEPSPLQRAGSRSYALHPRPGHNT